MLSKDELEKNGISKIFLTVQPVSHFREINLKVSKYVANVYVKARKNLLVRGEVRIWTKINEYYENIERVGKNK